MSSQAVHSGAHTAPQNDDLLNVNSGTMGSRNTKTEKNIKSVINLLGL